MTIRPFEPLMATIDPDSIEQQPDGDFNTGASFNGKDVYKRTIDIQSLSSWTPDEHDEFFIEAKGMYSDGTSFFPLKIASISSSGITLDNQTILPGYTGYCVLYFTESVPNQNKMSKFIVATIALIASASALFLSTDAKQTFDLAFNLFK